MNSAAGTTPAGEPVLVVSTNEHVPLLTISADGHLVWGDAIPAEEVGSEAARAFVEVFDHVWIAMGAIRNVEKMTAEQLMTVQEVIRLELLNRAEAN